MWHREAEQSGLGPKCWVGLGRLCKPSSCPQGMDTGDAGQLTCTWRALERAVLMLRMQRWAGGAHRRNQRTGGTRNGSWKSWVQCKSEAGVGVDGEQEDSLGQEENQSKGLKSSRNARAEGGATRPTARAGPGAPTKRLRATVGT